jgi:hypothetical protein
MPGAHSYMHMNMVKYFGSFVVAEEVRLALAAAVGIR